MLYNKKVLVLGCSAGRDDVVQAVMQCCVDCDAAVMQ